MEACGLTCFVLRTGFDPRASDPDLDAADEIVATLGAKRILLVGTWWGEGIVPGPRSMRPLRRLMPYGSGEAHESLWSMLPPGPKTNEAIAERVALLCERHQPDGICLTHARFRHAADIDGLFEVGTTPSFAAAMEAAGLRVAGLEDALDAMHTRLGGMDARSLAATAHGCDLAEFLDRLAASDVFSRWFRLRCALIGSSVREIFADVRGRNTAILLGTNAMSPLSSRLCGQDYAEMGENLDFIQPLLGYVRWHVIQPVAIWARYLRSRVSGLTDQEALRVGSSLLGLDADALDQGRVQLDAADEGPDGFILETVGRELELLRGIADTCGARLLPVLRGSDWNRDTIERLAHTVETSHLSGVLYQGTAFLAEPPPGPGWA